MEFWVILLAYMIALTAFAHRWIAVRAAAWCLSFKRIEEVGLKDGEFVKRTSLEGQFSVAIQRANSETVLLYGPRGSGRHLLSALL
jgi:hypothetical protein